MTKGIVLFAHGSRDPEWARPFEQLAVVVSRKASSSEVLVAYLEKMRPALGEAIDALAARGCDSVSVVPVFLGQGNHVKEDLPRLVAAAQAAHPRLKVVLHKPIGEQPAVIDAIAGAISEETS